MRDISRDKTKRKKMRGVVLRGGIGGGPAGVRAVRSAPFSFGGGAHHSASPERNRSLASRACGQTHLRHGPTQARTVCGASHAPSPPPPPTPSAATKDGKNGPPLHRRLAVPRSAKSWSLHAPGCRWPPPAHAWQSARARVVPREEHAWRGLRLTHALGGAHISRGCELQRQDLIHVLARDMRLHPTQQRRRHTTQWEGLRFSTDASVQKAEKR